MIVVRKAPCLLNGLYISTSEIPFFRNWKRPRPSNRTEDSLKFLNIARLCETSGDMWRWYGIMGEGNVVKLPVE